MKKNFLTSMISSGLVLGFILLSAVGCKAERFDYDNAKKYSVGGGSVTGTVTNVEIDWVAGDVNVEYGDVSAVTFSETSEDTIADDVTLRYWLENTTLHIKYAKSGLKLTNEKAPDKNLKVVLPSSLVLNELELDSVEANVQINGIKANEVDIESIAGNVNARLDGVRDFSVDIVSGNAELRFMTAPSEGEYQNVHGDLTLYLPEGTGFTLEVEKLNGSFSSEFETTKNGDRYVCGNGGNKYELETFSGNVSLKKM